MFFRSIFVLLLPNYNLGYCLFIKMKRIPTQKKITMRKFLLLVLLLAGSSLHGFAQADCFEYEDPETKTIITDLTEEGIANIVSSQAPYSHSITIPASVKTVKVNAFSSLSSYSFSYYTLNIEDGGDPLFESASETGDVNALDEDNSNTVVQHHIYGINVGNGMSLTNLEALIRCLGTRNDLASFTIDGLSVGDIKTINWTSTDFTEVLTNDVIVTIPAGQVMPSGQSFGNAQVYGQFSIPDELTESTFCGNVIFEDTDDGSNLLFYVTTGFSDSQVKLKRVHYIIPRNGDNPRQGVLMHVYNPNGNRTVALKRVTTDEITEENKYYYNDVKLFNSNMLIGTTAPTNITATENDYTNLILYNGLFYRTSGGILGANKAYLQMPTENLTGVPANAKLSLSFGDDAPTEINTLDTYHPTPNTHHPIYNIAGQRVDPNFKGIVIVNGKKIIR